MRTVLSVLLLAALVPACRSDYGQGNYDRDNGGDDDDDSGEPDGGDSPDGGATSIQIGATSGEAEVPFTFSVEASGYDRFGAISIDAPGGTAEFGGETYGLFVTSFDKTPPYNTYAAWGIGPNGFFAAWFYCYENGLYWIYSVAPGMEEMFEEADGGECTEIFGASTRTVELPALAMDFPAELVDSVAIAGDAVTFAGGAPGTLSIEGKELTILPWARYDWWEDGHIELDTLIYDAAAGTLSLGNLAVGGEGDQANTVRVSMGLTIPALERSTEIHELPAEVTIQDAGGGEGLLRFTPPAP
jgi:hypothetical protein